jgi:hypothetical protein
LTDSVLALAKDHVAVNNEPVVKFGLKYVETALLAATPPDRIVRAVSEEIADLVKRARAAIEAFTPSPEAREALDALKDEETFPRAALDAIAKRLRSRVEQLDLAYDLDAWTNRHRELEHRVGWMLSGTPRHVRETLDPYADADQLNHAVTSDFRFEARVVETLAINRIAQAANLGNMFRSTKEAETNAVMRFFDTYALYGNVLEWGVDSYRGRTAVERMNQIHGRYYIPNDEMKFVLLQGIFTWLDGMDRIGHRRISDKERRGMVASFVRMGQAMNIQDLTENYEEMYAWYRGVCVASAEFKPYKRTTFETIVAASVAGQPEALREGILLAGRVAMDETYLSSLGYPEPTKEEKQAVRAMFFTIGSMVEALPYVPYLRSLVNTPVRRVWTDPKELGTSERSRFMPAAFAGLPNGGLPEGQKPIRSIEEATLIELPDISWDEVRRRADEGQAVMVVDGFVYDLTTMREVHPGGATILKRWAGKDATRAFHAAKHASGTMVFSLNYRIGRVVGQPPQAQRDPLADVAEAIASHAAAGVLVAGD